MIGPNGAGKTTLLSILAGIVQADEGEVQLPQGEVGWVPQQAALYRRLTVEENLLLFARLEGHEDPQRSVEEMLELTGLEERRGRSSRGSRRQPAADQHRDRAAGSTGGPAARRAQRRPRSPPARAPLGVRLRPGRAWTTVIFSTHDIQEAERYGRRLLVLADGESLFHGNARGAARGGPQEAPEAAASDFETAFVAFLHHRGH